MTLKYFLELPLPVAILGDDHGLNYLHYFDRIYSLERFFLIAVCELVNPLLQSQEIILS